MGHFIWSDWGRLVALTTGTWNFWAGLWAVFYRKFFWDFVGGKLGPVGIIAPESAAPFMELIIKIPVIQAICILNGALTVLFEWPILPRTFFYRSLLFKTIFYVNCGLFAALLYQAADAAVLYLFIIFAYTVAIVKGEIVGEEIPSSSRV